MTKQVTINGALKVVAYAGDAKVLLAFDLTTEESRHRLAGFTIKVEPQAHPAYYLWNNLQFKHPDDHARIDGEPPYSTANAPIHKFRWVHVPGLDHQGLNPPFGPYRYTITPRYFDDAEHLTELDDSKSASLTIPLCPFKTDKLKLGFTRGFVQSQAFVRHFGNQLPTRPKGQPVNYDTSAQAGVDPHGTAYSYAEQYRWLGFTARERVFEIFDHVEATDGAKLDMFAYDLNEPDVIKALLELRDQGKVRIILDNADLHHDDSDPTPEDEFTGLFSQNGGAANIRRGKFGRYAHDKILIVYEGDKPARVLTGSTNFSVTGLYVNSNHVLVFDDPEVAKLYAQVFEEVWQDHASKTAFAASAFAKQSFPFAAGDGLPAFDVTFSPRAKAEAASRLQEIVDRCQHEADSRANVFFAVMELSGGASNPVYAALTELHKNTDLFSYGISDHPDGISLYPVGSDTGVLVTGKPGRTDLPPPFNQVPSIGAGHQIHHKFVVCGFGRPDGVVYCGSSNLALTGEQVNGDNLLCIQDVDVVTAFTIEALLLIDHFNFLDSTAKAPKGEAVVARTVAPPAEQRSAAKQAGWFLGTTDAWARRYFDLNDLHCRDRVMFAA